MEPIRVAQILVFSTSAAASFVLIMSPFLLKGAGRLGGALWLTAAVFSIVGAIGRWYLVRRQPQREGWIRALRPTVLGSAVVLAVTLFVLVVLPMIALAS